MGGGFLRFDEYGFKGVTWGDSNNAAWWGPIRTISYFCGDFVPDFCDKVQGY